jgi:hypothetical protein
VAVPVVPHVVESGEELEGVVCVEPVEEPIACGELVGDVELLEALVEPLEPELAGAELLPPA